VEAVEVDRAGESGGHFGYAAAMVGVARLALSVLLLTAASSSARADDERTEAKAHTDLGRVAFGRGDFRKALDEFLQAYDAAPVPELLYNIGRCQGELGLREQAIASYRKYLAARPDADDRDAVNAKIEQLSQAPPPPPQPPPPPPPTVTPQPPPPTVVAPVAPHRGRGWIAGTVVAAAVVVIAAVVLGVYFGTRTSFDDFPPVMVRN
jgi:tetratricopeptide (TPR) repeat protein